MNSNVKLETEAEQKRYEQVRDQKIMASILAVGQRSVYDIDADDDNDADDDFDLDTAVIDAERASEKLDNLSPSRDITLHYVFALSNNGLQFVSAETSSDSVDNLVRQLQTEGFTDIGIVD